MQVHSTTCTKYAEQNADANDPSDVFDVGILLFVVTNYGSSSSLVGRGVRCNFGHFIFYIDGKHI